MPLPGNLEVPGPANRERLVERHCGVRGQCLGADLPIQTRVHLFAPLRIAKVGPPHTNAAQGQHRDNRDDHRYGDEGTEH